MAKKFSMSDQILNTLRGTLMFITVITGSTYYLQSSLILFKKYGSHAHWTIVLIVLPLFAGLLLRLARVYYPLICSILGSLVSAAILYPQYKTFWAVPPTMVDLAIYIAIVLGLGYIATQPLRTTFMIAFHLGRFAVPSFTASSDSSSKRQVKRSASPRATTKKKEPQQRPLSITQRLHTSQNGNAIALLELLIGFSSLVLSIISIFILGRG
jgi:hypothetical protein